LEVEGPGQSGPIDADEGGRQSARQASSMNVGREVADGELMEIIEILPRFEQ
jgi:hypothetical protein